MTRDFFFWWRYGGTIRLRAPGSGGPAPCATMTTMKRQFPAIAVLLLWAVAAPTTGVPVSAQDAPTWTATLEDIRRTASVIPGPRPLRINFQKFTESRRTKNFSVEGAPATPSIQARTAFQVIYPDGHVMVDAGMDLTVHSFFGRGVKEPYFPEAVGQVEQAVRDARLIVVTHEHAIMWQG